MGKVRKQGDCLKIYIRPVKFQGCLILPKELEGTLLTDTASRKQQIYKTPALKTVRSENRNMK